MREPTKFSTVWQLVSLALLTACTLLAIIITALMVFA